MQVELSINGQSVPAEIKYNANSKQPCHTLHLFGCPLPSRSKKLAVFLESVASDNAKPDATDNANEDAKPDAKPDATSSASDATDDATTEENKSSIWNRFISHGDES